LKSKLKDNSKKNHREHAEWSTGKKLGRPNQQFNTETKHKPVHLGLFTSVGAVGDGSNSDVCEQQTLLVRGSQSQECGSGRMKLKKPTQAPDNPHDIVENPMGWARHEYEASRGSMHGLLDAAKRYKLMSAIALDRNVTQTVAEAMSYLLEVPYES
jgi:hypothetical protein